MSRRIYKIINGIVVLLSLVIFYFVFAKDISKMFHENLLCIIILFGVVILVHIIKSFRFYFILTGEHLSKMEYMKQYCKTVPISAIIPLKLGDLFKVYCYGYQLNNYYSGIVFVLLDRFFDTLGLLTMISIVSVFWGIHFGWIFSLLLIFAVSILVLYIIIPNICTYWNQYLIGIPATKHNIGTLSFVNRTAAIVKSVSGAIKGKGVISYVLSLFAWSVELFGALLINRIKSGSGDLSIIQKYLSAALGWGGSLNLTYFVLGTVVLLLFVYAVLHVYAKWRDRTH